VLIWLELSARSFRLILAERGCERVGDHCGDHLAASLRQEKVQQGVGYRLDDVEILAVQVEIIEGRQSDQSYRNTAVHADIEAAIV